MLQFDKHIFLEDGVGSTTNWYVFFVFFLRFFPVTKKNSTDPRAEAQGKFETSTLESEGLT